MESRSEADPAGHQNLLARLKEAAAVLTQSGDLTPANRKLNSCLTAFVRAVLDCDCPAQDCALLDHPDVRSVRLPVLQKLAEAECEMEKFYAQDGRLADFPYHDNYRELVADEILTLRETAHNPLLGGVYFVGSGPLPLTAVEFHRQTGGPVICVERDAEAVRLSREVIAALGLSGQITVIEADSAAMDYNNAGLVMIAALVDAKDETILRIRKTASQALIGVRSAEGARTLLYEAVDPAVVSQHGYDLRGRTRLSKAVINTTLFFAPQTMCAAHSDNSRTNQPIPALR